MDELESADDLKIPADLLRTFLSGRDVPCPQCEYNLRDLAGTHCPECGEEIFLGVNLAEPKQKLLIAGLVGLSAGAGLNGLLLVYLAIDPLILRRFSPRIFLGRSFLTNAGGLLVEGIAMAIWLRLWRRIRRATLKRRMLLMIACWAITLLDIVVFTIILK